MDPQVPKGGSEPRPDLDQSFSTKAYSGQSADGVGFAGALAIHNIETTTRAAVTGAADITAVSLTLAATNLTSHEAVAAGAQEEADYTAGGGGFAADENPPRGPPGRPPAGPGGLSLRVTATCL
jgi:hypothetical protein